MVVVSTLLVSLFQLFFGIFQGKIVFVCITLCTIGKRRLQVNVQDIFLIFQNIIRASADNNGISFGCNIANDLRLCQEKAILRRNILRGVAISFIYQVEKKVAGHFFFLGTYEGLAQLTFIGCHVNQILVEELQTERFGKLIGNLMSTAAILTTNGNAKPLGFGRSSFFFGRSRFCTEELLRKKRKHAGEDTGNVADKKCSNNSTFSDAIQLMGEDKGKNNGTDSHGYIKGNFCRTEFCFGGKDNGTNQRFTRKHNNVCQNLNINAKAKDQAADQKVKKLHDINLRSNKGKHCHTQINKIAEGNCNRKLQKMFQFEIFP